MKSHLKSALLATAFCLPFSVGAAFAAPVSISASFLSTITVPENGGTDTLDYTLTNNTTGAINIFSVNTSLTLINGDASDGVSLGPTSFGTCSSSLAPGGTCTAHFRFVVDDGTGETDGDTGVTDLILSWQTDSGLSTGPLDTTITVTDPTPAVTPLPGTLPLFATGLGALGLLGWRRKRKARAGVA